MKRLEDGESSTAAGLLRVEFSDKVSADTLVKLHSAGLTGDIPDELRDSIVAAGGKRISGVYELSRQEMVTDRYGFAREFKLYLQPGVETGKAIEALSHSPFIKSVRAVLLREY